MLYLKINSYICLSALNKDNEFIEFHRAISRFYKTEECANTNHREQLSVDIPKLNYKVLVSYMLRITILFLDMHL